jgi:3-dehydroquinate dehydratase-2
MAKILVLHGPNLNLLGARETEHYGSITLAAINAQLGELGKELGHEISFLQSNAEHILIDKLHESQLVDFMIINPGAFTHTSIALRDAIQAIAKPFVEVHISNIHKREAFRRHSYFSDIAVGTITGLGAESYLLALRYAHRFLTHEKTHEGVI